MKTRSIALGLVGAAVLVGGGLAGYQMYIERQAEQRIAAAVAELPSTVKLQYGDVEVGLLGDDVRIKDLTLQVEGKTPITVAEVQLLDFDRQNNPPNYLHAKALGIRQAVSGDDGQPPALRTLGYGEVRGNYELQYHYDPASRELDLQQLQGAIEDMGAVSLRMKLSNVDLRRQPANQLPEYALRSLELRYTDHSLVRRVISQGAAEQGVSEAEFVDGLRREIAAQAAALGGPFFARFGEALSVFVGEPGSLTISAAPAQPVPVMEIISGALIHLGELPEQLNMTVEVNR